MTQDVHPVEAEQCKPCPQPSARDTSETKHEPISGGTTTTLTVPTEQKLPLVPPPETRDNTCGLVGKASPKSTTTTTTTPQLCATIKWEGEWALDKEYKNGKTAYKVNKKPDPEATPAPVNDEDFEYKIKEGSENTEIELETRITCISIVRHNGSAFICKKAHTSTIGNQPVSPNNNLEFKGAWTIGTEYKATATGQKASTVSYAGKKYLCIQNNTAELSNVPLDPDGDDTGEGVNYWTVIDGENGSVGEGTEYWDLLVSGNSTTTGSTGDGFKPDDRSLLDKLKDWGESIWDWAKNADLVDWLLAGAAAAGIIWAGTKIYDKLNPDPEDLEEDQGAVYNGSPGYSGASSSPSIRTVVGQLCDYAGIVYDNSLLSNTETAQFVIASNTQVRSILEQLASAFNFDMVDSGGVLKFVPKNTTPVATLTLDDMGYSASNDIITPYTAKRYQGITLPKSISMTYISKDIDYNNFTQKAELFTFEEGQSINISVPIIMSHERARHVCEMLLVNSHLERMNYTFNTSYKFIHLEPGDVINSPVGLIRIIKMEELEEGILRFEATDAGDDSALTYSGLNVQIPATSTNVPKVTSLTSAFFLDPNVIDDNDKSIRLYVAACGFDKPNWSGCGVFQSDDNGASFNQVATIIDQSTVGLVATPTPYVQYQVWDETTTIDVKLSSGTLISQSESAVLNGANRCMIGKEIIAFCNATLIAPKTYRLSKLIRGRQGTEIFSTDHVANEIFVMIDTLTRIDLKDNDRNTTKKFKVVSIGADVSSGEVEEIYIVSNNTKCWTVGNLTHTQTSDDVVLTWKERPRYNNGLKDFTSVIHDYDYGGFGVAVQNPDGSIRASYVSQQEKFTYTKSMQIADWGGLHGNCKFTVLQLSNRWGAGYPTEINT